MQLWWAETKISWILENFILAAQIHNNGHFKTPCYSKVKSLHYNRETALGGSGGDFTIPLLQLWQETVVQTELIFWADFPRKSVTLKYAQMIFFYLKDHTYKPILCVYNFFALEAVAIPAKQTLL